MGRYYSGDIEGKFWFGVQCSDDASFFGGEIYEPSEITYYFSSEDIDAIKNGLEKCDKELGEYKNKLDEFFKQNNGYNNEMLEKEFELTAEKTSDLLTWYARRELGEKILICVMDKGNCEFVAEL